MTSRMAVRVTAGWLSIAVTGVVTDTGGCYTLGEGPSRTDRNRAQTRVDPPLKTDENLRRGGGF